jgi:hypothetical protein
LASDQYHQSEGKGETFVTIDIAQLEKVLYTVLHQQRTTIYNPGCGGVEHDYLLPPKPCKLLL